MQKFANALVFILIAAGLSGCGWFSRDDDDYRIAESTPPLEVPPGLRSPGAESTYEIPGHDGDETQVTESFQIDSNMTESWRRVINSLESMGQVRPRDIDQENGRISLTYRGEEGAGDVELVLVPVSVEKTTVRVSGAKVAAKAVADNLRNRLVSGSSLGG